MALRRTFVPSTPREVTISIFSGVSHPKSARIGRSKSPRAGIPLKIAAKVDAADREYFKFSIEPLLDHPLVEFIGEIGEAQKCAFLGNARALLFPIDWPEPFGLVMIEAMSAGTPVIAWAKGSVPEVVVDHVSGRIVNSIDEAVDHRVFPH
jgi:glycosyltransferase involved in cell wall biosynthesis